MRLNIMLALTVTQILDCFMVSCKTRRFRFRVFEGEDAPIEKFPWATRIEKYHTGVGFAVMQRYCSGARLSPDWVLTAGHCTDGTHIRVGEAHALYPNDKDSFIKILTTLQHPCYKKDKIKNGHETFIYEMSNDIALVKSEFYQLPQYAVVSAADYMSLIGYEAYVMGYGQTGYDQLVTIINNLQYATGLIKYCDKVDMMNGLNGYPNFCLARKSADTTLLSYGDSGGPVVYDNLVIGVNSFLIFPRSRRFADDLDMIVATPVSPYLDWINYNVGASSTRKGNRKANSYSRSINETLQELSNKIEVLKEIPNKKSSRILKEIFPQSEILKLKNNEVLRIVKWLQNNKKWELFRSKSRNLKPRKRAKSKKSALRKKTTPAFSLPDLSFDLSSQGDFSVPAEAKVPVASKTNHKLKKTKKLTNDKSYKDKDSSLSREVNTPKTKKAKAKITKTLKISKKPKKNKKPKKSDKSSEPEYRSDNSNFVPMQRGSRTKEISDENRSEMLQRGRKKRRKTAKSINKLRTNAIAPAKVLKRKQDSSDVSHNPPIRQIRLQKSNSEERDFDQWWANEQQKNVHWPQFRAERQYNSESDIISGREEPIYMYIPSGYFNLPGHF